MNVTLKCDENIGFAPDELVIGSYCYQYELLVEA